MSVRFRLLGPVSAHHDDHPIDLGPARQRHVLAALLVDAGRVVTAGELTLVPYYAWANRGPAPMRVWIPTI